VVYRHRSHHIQVFMPKDIAVASCASDAQIWDMSDPANPTISNGEPHTHIYSQSANDQFEFISSGIVSWDGKKLAVMDETGDGVEAVCDGAASEDGFTYFYRMVEPGDPAPPLRARYTIARPQTPELCVSHNANVIPVRGRDIMSAAYYQGGNTVVDFTDLDNVREVAFPDLEDATGLADSVVDLLVQRPRVRERRTQSSRRDGQPRRRRVQSRPAGAAPGQAVGVLEPADAGGVPGPIGPGSRSRGPSARRWARQEGALRRPPLAVHS
jgi:hypothetical protein